MAWRELSLVLERTSLDRVSAALFGIGCAGIQEEHLPGQAPPPRQPWDTGPLPPPTRHLILRAWFEDPDEAQVQHRLQQRCPGLEPRWSDVPEEDWEISWRRGLEPVRISERLVVSPPWCAPEGAVVIEPGQGFGTGTHPTTRAALVALDELADEVHTVLDLGSGSGVLAIAAARLGKVAWGVDHDPTAVVDAQANARRNGVSPSFSTTPIAQLQQPAELVLANLFAEALADMGDDLVRLTGRYLVVAGVLVDRERLVRDVLEPHLHLHARVVDGEWVSLRYRRP